MKFPRFTIFLLRCGKIFVVLIAGDNFVQTQARIHARSTAAVAVVDVRALVSLIVVSLLGLSLILSDGAELLRGP